MNRTLETKTGFRTARIISGVSAVLAFISGAQAQPFTYTNNDLLLGFRKTGGSQAYEVVVNIGQATTYTGLAAGSSLSVPNFTLSQLTPDSFSDLNNLNWSVFGYALTNKSIQLPGYVNYTLWLTVPRANPSVQGPTPNRLDYISQANVAVEINSIGSNARYLSSVSAAGQDNTAKFVRESTAYPDNILTKFISSSSDATASTFQDTWYQNVEITTPASFSGSVISDFYEIRPTVDALGNPVTDPHTGQTSGPAYYLGYFQFNSNGTMTFTRASATRPPPPPPVLTISRSSTTSTIYFGTTNGATYKLYFTNASGLGTPVSNWPSSPTTLTGNGSTQSLTDTTTDPIRFYKVGAH